MIGKQALTKMEVVAVEEEVEIAEEQKQDLWWVEKGKASRNQSRELRDLEMDQQEVC